MDLNALAVFVAVVDQQSFVGASRVLGTPTSTVSRRIAALEEHLGLRLLHRTTRRVQVTEAGQDLYQRVAGLVSEAQAAEQAVRERRDEPSGLLRVTTPALFGQAFLFPVLSEYLEHYHHVRVDVMATDRLVDLVAEGFDVAIRPHPRGDSDLVARKLGPARGVLCAAPSYLAVHGVPASPAELADHDCVLFSQLHTPSTWAFEGPQGSIEVEVQGRIRVNDVSLAHRAAVQGLGVARIPMFLAAAELRSGRLVRLLEGWSRPEGWLSVVYPGGRYVPAKVRTFVELLVERVGPVPPWDVDAG